MVMFLPAWRDYNVSFTHDLLLKWYRGMYVIIYKSLLSRNIEEILDCSYKNGGRTLCAIAKVFELVLYMHDAAT